MNATRLGLAALVAAWLMVLASFLAGSWGSGLASLGVVAVLASTRRPFLAPRPQVRREVEGAPVQGRVLTVTAQGNTPTEGLIEVDMPVPLGFTLIRQRREVGRGRFLVTQDLQAVAVGHVEWPPLTVRVTDRWGLAAEERQVPAPAPLTILPDPEWAIRGRRLGLKKAVQTTIRAPMASERSLEIERVRPYQVGDTMRDIDWKATARHQGLQVRERERHIPRPVTVVLDCGATMRVQRNDMKLLSASRVAYGVLSAAAGAGTPGHLVVAKADHCRSLPVRGLGQAESALREVLAASPPLSPRSPAEPKVDPTRVLHAVGNAPGLQVLVLDGEEDPDLAEDLMLHLKERGPVAVVLPASGAHLYRRHEARRQVLGALRRWRRHRRAVQQAGARLRIPVLVLRPGNEGEVLERVTRMLT